MRLMYLYKEDKSDTSKETIPTKFRNTHIKGRTKIHCLSEKHLSRTRLRLTFKNKQLKIRLCSHQQDFLSLPTPFIFLILTGPSWCTAFLLYLHLNREILMSADPLLMCTLYTNKQKAKSTTQKILQSFFKRF